jgi:hypothetical protein
MILIMQGRNKRKPQGNRMRNSHDRRSAAHGRKAILVTEKRTEPKPEEAISRKAESQSGEPGFPGMLKFLIPTEVIEPTGKIATTLRMQ